MTKGTQHTHSPEVNAKDEKEVGHMKVNTAQIQKMNVSAAGEVITHQKGRSRQEKDGHIVTGCGGWNVSPQETYL